MLPEKTQKAISYHLAAWAGGHAEITADGVTGLQCELGDNGGSVQRHGNRSWRHIPVTLERLFQHLRWNVI
jgi:hypothetical protein